LSLARQAVGLEFARTMAATHGRQWQPHFQANFGQCAKMTMGLMLDSTGNYVPGHAVMNNPT